MQNLKNQLCNELISSGRVKEFDVIRHSYSKARMQDGRTASENNISPTLDTRCDCLGVVVKQHRRQVGIDLIRKNARVREISSTIKARYDSGLTNHAPGSTGVLEIYDDGFRIRKLTPRECFRLMGVKDSEFEKICYGKPLPEGSLDKLHSRTMSKSEWKDYWRIARNQKQSNGSLYHLAGDSIVINVLEAIFKQML